MAALHERTEGWAGGLRLAALSLAGHPDPDGFAAEFSGSDRTVAEYLMAKVLDRQSDDVRRLLLRTLALERINGELADLLTAGSGGERMLQDLEEANTFVVSLDAARSWFRYHHLFVGLLQLELRRTEPDTVAELHQLAATSGRGPSKASGCWRRLPRGRRRRRARRQMAKSCVRWRYSKSGMPRPGLAISTGPKVTWTRRSRWRAGSDGRISSSWAWCTGPGSSSTGGCRGPWSPAGRQAVGLAEQHGWTADLFASFAANTLGSALTWQGQLDEAEIWVRRAERTFRAEADPASAMGPTTSAASSGAAGPPTR